MQEREWSSRLSYNHGNSSFDEVLFIESPIWKVIPWFKISADMIHIDCLMRTWCWSSLVWEHVFVVVFGLIAGICLYDNTVFFFFYQKGKKNREQQSLIKCLWVTFIIILSIVIILKKKKNLCLNGLFESNKKRRAKEEKTKMGKT